MVPAILENEAITGLLGRTGGGGGRRGRTMSDADVKPGIQQALDGLLAELTGFYRTLGYHGVDPEVISQVWCITVGQSPCHESIPYLFCCVPRCSGNYFISFVHPLSTTFCFGKTCVTGLKACRFVTICLT